MFGLKKRRRAPQNRRIDGGEMQIAGRSVALAIVEHSRAKRLTLRVEPGGRSIRVTVPPGVDRAEIDRFVNRHFDWLTGRIERLPDQQQLQPGMKIPLRGVPHRIVHIPDRRGVTHTDQDAGEAILVIHGDQRHLGRRIADYLKKLAKAEIGTLAAKHAATVGRPVRAIRYRDTTSRWGSCSADGNLSFSWRIMMAPPRVIDYLVAHEVAHLREMNHGAKFWELCRSLSPRTDECKDWLKRNGSKLQAIPF